ncbi:hypothetical protein [Spirillospora sp. NPDC029432]|uniref:hypothetical protein n=1 Tax=Spirillospora sp. NPDC029432 TaxID=3154599 RepID=UPI0034514CE6
MGKRARKEPWPGSCPRCGGRQEYSDPFDAALCPRCDEWREPACPDPQCSFCRNRPLRPSLARELHPDDPALRRAARLAARRSRRSR